MGYKEFANGELLTAQKVNDYLMRQAVIEIADQASEDAITTPHDGMIVYRDDLDVYRARINGAWKQVMPMPHIRVQRTTDQTLSASFAAVSFDSAPVQKGLTWSIANPTRVTFPMPGLAICLANPVQINTTGNGSLQLRLNGTGGLATHVVTNTSGASVMALSDPFVVAAGDYAEIMAQSNGAFPIKPASYFFMILQHL